MTHNLHVGVYSISFELIKHPYISLAWRLQHLGWMTGDLRSDDQAHNSAKANDNLSKTKAQANPTTSYYIPP